MVEEDRNMTFMQHLEEMRWRLVRCAIAVLSVSLVLWWFQDWVMKNVFLSMKDPDFVTFRFLCKHFGFFCMSEIPVKFQSTTMGGQFGYAIWMSFMGGVVLASPFIFYQIWAFVKPGLKLKEKKMVNGVVFYITLLFLTGILFGYFMVAPMTVQFFSTYKITGEINNNFNIGDFMSTVISTVFYTGLFFLLPVVAYIMGKFGIVSSGFLKKYRKHAIVGVLILSAIITPPEIISQIIVSIPILLLYEVGIVVVKRQEKKRLTEV